MFFLHDPFNVLDHNDGIIHQKTDGKYHGKHGQGVNRETEDINDRKCTEYNYRYCQRWNNRCTPVLQEQEHDEEY